LSTFGSNVLASANAAGAGLCRAPIQKPRRRKVAEVDEVVATPDQRRQFVGVDLPGD
jgi:hypothetical protein